jgi:16S rRNA (guanine527-N7)-methyltransferase
VILELATRIQDRAAAAGVPCSPALAGQAAAYLDLLAHWNRTINLTGFALEPPGDEAVDRLVIEPFAAATHFRVDDCRVIDVGSGGGSPALLLKIARPDLEFTLIESKSRKAAFLREAARHLGLTDVRVENARLEEVTARGDLRGYADVVTVRAVRQDAELLRGVATLLRAGGVVFAFGREFTVMPGQELVD